MNQTQQEISTQSNPYMSPMHEYGSAIIQMTNPSQELYKMEMTLRSNMIDLEGNIKDLGKPLMNDEGINSVIGIVQSIVSQTTIMSNMDKASVPVLMDSLNDTLATDLMINMQKYGIKDIVARDKIKFIALTTAYSCLRRAFEEGDRRFWKNAQPIESRVFMEGQQKKGLLSGLFTKRN